MRIKLFTLKTLKAAPPLALVFLIPFFGTAPNTDSRTQDQTFRLMNIERRLDQLQSRVDFIERAIQNREMRSAASPNVSTEALLELQRQQLSLAEQLVTMQRRMLEMQKAIDRLASREGGQEKKETPKEEAKPKAAPKKP